MLALHIIAMVTTSIGAFVKAILLLLDRKQAFHKVQTSTSTVTKILLIIGVLAGIYMVIFHFGGRVPPWLIIKLAIFVTGGLIVSWAEKRENKVMLLIGASMLLLAWFQANEKITY